MKKIIMLLTSLLATVSPLRAQTLPSSSVLAAAGADSVVQVTAEAQGLRRVAPEDLPLFGTWWAVLPNGSIVPLPCRPPEASVVYAITGNVFLADATGGQIAVNPRQAAAASPAALQDAAATLSAAVVNLIGQVQTAEVNLQAQAATPSLIGRSALQALDAPSFGLTGGGGGALKSAANALVIDTNQLYLTATGVTNGVGYFQLHQTNTAAAKVFAIWSSTNLVTGSAGWRVEQELWPGGTNPVTFAVSLAGRNPLFVRAEDLTGVMVNGLPMWWLLFWFGDLTETADTLDVAGRTLLYDYQNGLDPIPLQFYGISAANNYVAAGPTALTLSVSGRPGYMAVVVDNTNFQAAATWQAYPGSNLTVNVGNTEGWHEVWIGLRGHADTPAEAIWQRKRLKLDRTPPQLFLTGLTNRTVTVPVMQLTGYSPEDLRAVRYAVSNAQGTVTNQPVCVLSRALDTNLWQYGTNTFQAFDVPLAAGANVFTLSAADRAGNVAVTNFTLTLDYARKTNPPVVQLRWPTNGAWVCGHAFTGSGTVSDPTAVVQIGLIQPDGTTNFLAGNTGRDGGFYVPNVPLAAGTNRFWLRATDAAGHVTLTNFTVVQGDAGLAIDPIPDNQTTVTGHVAPGYGVTVNGVAATVNADGAWQAENVPLPPQGSLVTAMARPANYPAAPEQTATAAANASGLYLAGYGDGFLDHYDVYTNGVPLLATDHQFMIGWADAAGGAAQILYRRASAEAVQEERVTNTWPATAWPQPWPDSLRVGNGDWLASHYAYVGWQWCDQAFQRGWRIVTTGDWGTYTEVTQEHFQEAGLTAQALATGGQPGSTAVNLWQITVAAQARNFAGSPNTDDPPDGQVQGPLAGSQLTAGVFGTLDDHGTGYALLADNTRVDATVQATGPGADYYTYASATKPFHFVHQTHAPALTDTNLARLQVGVGEYVDLKGMPEETVWSVTAGGLSTNVGASVLFTAPSNAPPSGLTATVTATVKDVTIKTDFTVFPPTGVYKAVVTSYASMKIGIAGAQMNLDVWMAPADVSFYRVSFSEVGGDATNATGYLADTNFFPDPWHHCPNLDNTNNYNWQHLPADNHFTDWAGFIPKTLPQPRSPGSLTFNIPVIWKIGETGQTNSLGNSIGGWKQFIAIDQESTVTVQKFGKIVMRTILDEITPPLTPP